MWQLIPTRERMSELSVSEPADYPCPTDTFCSSSGLKAAESESKALGKFCNEQLPQTVTRLGRLSQTQTVTLLQTQTVTLYRHRLSHCTGADCHTIGLAGCDCHMRAEWGEILREEDILLSQHLLKRDQYIFKKL